MPVPKTGVLPITPRAMWGMANEHCHRPPDVELSKCLNWPDDRLQTSSAIRHARCGRIEPTMRGLASTRSSHAAAASSRSWSICQPRPKCPVRRLSMDWTLTDGSSCGRSGRIAFFPQHAKRSVAGKVAEGLGPGGRKRPPMGLVGHRGFQPGCIRGLGDFSHPESLKVFSGPLHVQERHADGS